MSIKDIIANKKTAGSFFEGLGKHPQMPTLRAIAKEIWDTEGKKRLDALEKDLHDALDKHVYSVLQGIKKGDPGTPGDEPDDARLSLLIQKLIPDPVHGKTPTKKELRAIMAPLIPPPLSPKTFSKDDIRNFITEYLIDEEKKGLTISSIIGLDETIESIYKAINTKIRAAKPYLHGGGSSTGTVVSEEALTGTGTSFTLAHTPNSGTLKLYRGGARQQAGIGKDFTLSGATITLAVTKATDEVLIADYSYT